MRTSNLPGKLHATLMMLFCIALMAASPASAQKKGGTLRLYHNDNPPSTSLHEEATIASVTPFAAIFNNLVVFDPAKVHESIDTVIPDLAESWSWDSTNTKLTFKLRAGREMARWPAVHGKGRAVHLADADRQNRDPGLQTQSAKSLVHEA